MHGHEEGMRGIWGRLWRNPAVLTLHLSFVVIMAGALCTWILQERGAVRLWPGEAVTEFWLAEGKPLPLPVVMELDSFRVEYYPGGGMPRDYVSYLKADGRPCVVSMNRILEIQGYRFCQSGYDYDGSTILTVNHDPWGIALVYGGFAMFAVSGLWVMLSRQGRWRSLMRSLSLVILILFPGDVFAAGAPVDEAGRILSLCAVSFTVLIPVMLFAGAVLAFLAVSGRRMLRRGSDLALCVAATVSAACFLMQWILSGHVPLSNTYETLFFAILILEILVMFVSRQGFLLRGIAMTFAGALALMAWMMGERGGETPLMPVLNTPWLAIHVSLVMTAYALLGLTFVTAVAGLVSPASAERMRRVSLSALYPAEWLLGMGIITGAVWANISWGCYWSWDPKETLALVTFLIYALPLHSNVSFLRAPRRYHVYMLLAILSVATTYFGVNLFRSLHAY